MTVVEIVAIAVGLAMDAFAVSLAGGAGGRLRGSRSALRLAFHLGLFQALMPVMGWYAGSQAAGLVGSFGRLVACLLLAVVGSRMVVSGLRGDPERGQPPDPSKGWTLVALSVATSIDAFAVGISLAMIGVDIWMPSVTIGVVTAALSLAGIAIGGRAARGFGPRVEVAGGLVLLAIGLRILISG